MYITSQKGHTHVIFIRKGQELAGYPPYLQNVERGQSFRNREPIVQLVVDYEVGRGP